MATNPDRIPNPTACTRAGNTTMTLQRPLPRRLLGVWAHPDDEAYLSAGLMARVVAAGGQVTVITATRGEKGTDDPDRYDSESFGAHRELELRNSLAVLGVNDVRFLDLRDGECDLAEAATQIGRIAAVIDEVRPDAIVTFGPDGMTNHADHLAISRWASDAWTANPIGELLYATVTHRFAVANRELHDRIGIFGDFPDGRARSVGDDRIALGCALTESELDIKRLALSAHHSQTAGLAKLMGEDVYRSWFQEETFRCPTRFELAPAIASAPVFEANRVDGSAAAGSTIPALELAA